MTFAASAGRRFYKVFVKIGKKQRIKANGKTVGYDTLWECTKCKMRTTNMSTSKSVKKFMEDATCFNCHPEKRP